MSAGDLRTRLALVTGVAGFIGSHLAELLVSEGREVRGVDAFTDYYSRSTKERNLEVLRRRKGFSFIQGDLGDMDLDALFDGADVVFHLAGQPGVRPSWGSDFLTYTRHNVLVTQRMLETARRWPISKFVYASSSSVYGDAETFPTSETARPQPLSPYGVTKLAAEHLCELYRKAFDVPAVSLRLFTVYGPRQRPDMAFAKLIRASFRGEPFHLYGDGNQTRDFTYVGDVARAMSDVAQCGWFGVANVGGGARTSMNQVIDLVASFCGPVEVIHGPSARGDVRHTAADTGIARHAFGYTPRTSLASGLHKMAAWERTRPLEVALR